MTRKEYYTVIDIAQQRFTDWSPEDPTNSWWVTFQNERFGDFMRAMTDVLKGRVAPPSLSDVTRRLEEVKKDRSKLKLKPSGYNCMACRDTGTVFYTAENGYEYAKPCDCVNGFLHWEGWNKA